jgi:hypothetical protein
LVVEPSLRDREWIDIFESATLRPSSQGVRA